MALATQCPHCHTTFRVAADQLKLRGGIVRCGSCQRIFDGNAHLIDLDKPAAPAPSAPASASASAPVEEDAALPVYTLDFDHTFDPLGIIPKPVDDAPEPPRAHVWRRAPEAETEEVPESAALEAPITADYAPVGRVEPQLEPVVEAAHDTAPPADTIAEPPPADRIEPAFDLPVTEEIVAQPLPDYEPEPEPEPVAAPPEPEPIPEPEPPASAPASDAPPFLPLRASAASEPPAPAPAMIPPVVKPARSKAARASEARARRSKLTPTKIEPPKLRLAADGDADEPEFVKRSRRQERMGRTQRMLMAAGAVVLLLLLLAQVVLGFRNTLAAQHPGLKPALAAACTVLGCQVELPAQAENLVIETGELTTLGPNTYALNTLLRNQGSLVLAWPSIELELTDANDKPVLRRVLAPADYLPRGTSPATGFGPHSEQPVALHFTLDGLQPSGYHTFVFYP
ncbi:MJ0042 family finger-like domain-containing protein [Massilia sp. PDC64]|nr:DUF3426 domain-containing protein [Massilia sp. PDC64]SDC42550.1 MJ0042 family finger-like domain-containing protein [Massilia sp. PDC64]